MTTPEEDKLPKPEDEEANAPAGEGASTDWQGRAVSVDAAGDGVVAATAAEIVEENREPHPGEGETIALAKSTSSDDDENEDDMVDAPVQMGGQRFVYAAYFAGGIAIAFLLSKATSYAWARLALWKPVIGEPHDEIVMPIAALVGAGVAFFYYRDEKTRILAEEVASELGKVTWPSRDEVQNSTVVVIITTLIATAFFFLMDRFWGFVTNLVYGA
jgi:preprotein translocase subunit SecE